MLFCVVFSFSNHAKSQNIECASGHCGKETKFAFNRCIGTSCKRDNDCDTGRCDSGVCMPKLGSCEVCDEDADCMFGHCSTLYRCSGEDGLMDDDCACIFNGDCRSGRCEGLKPRICEAQLGLGAYCNENDDCLSGHCSWKFRCEETSWWSRHKNTEAVKGSKATASAISIERGIDFDSENIRDQGVGEKHGGESAADASDASDEDAVTEKSGDEGALDEPDASHKDEAAGSKRDENALPASNAPKEEVSKAIDSQGHARSTTIKIAISAFLILLVMGLGYWVFFWKKRHGYEEIPTRLNE